jgi:exonuclease SbcD
MGSSTALQCKAKDEPRRLFGAGAASAVANFAPHWHGYGMLRILHTADWHLGKRFGRFERLEEQQRVLEELVRLARAWRADAVLIAGDLFDTKTPPVEAQRLFYDALFELAQGGERIVVAIAGNHDLPEWLDARARWGYPLGILLAGLPFAALPSARLSLGQAVLEELTPGVVRLLHPRWEEPLQLLLTPYVSEVRLGERLQQPQAEYLHQRWRHGVQQLRPDVPTVLLAHLYCIPAEGEPPQEDEEERPSALGGAEAIGVSSFPEGIDYVALGHLHRPMELPGGCCPVVYAGSPLQYSATDPAPEKSVVLLELSAGEVHYERYRLSEGCSIVQLRAQSLEEALRLLEQHSAAYVRLLLSCPMGPGELEQLRRAHERLEIALDPLSSPLSQIQQPQARVEGLDPLELFRAFYREREGTDPSPELQELFRELWTLQQAVE